jgi:hypothetical protein
MERWNVVGKDVRSGRNIEITGTESLTICAKMGIELEANTSSTSCLYGDFIANPKKRVDKQ